MEQVQALVPMEVIASVILVLRGEKVFDALRELMAAPEPSDRPIGFEGSA